MKSGLCSRLIHPDQDTTIEGTTVEDTPIEDTALEGTSDQDTAGDAALGQDATGEGVMGGDAMMAMATHIDGTSGDDVLVGTGGDDVIDGLGGNDNIQGLIGSDSVVGGTGNDDLYGGRSDANVGEADGDLVSGQEGSDLVVGSDGSDDLRGGPGNDTIRDARENDAKVDTISGHDGDDQITSANNPHSRDVVNCGIGTDSVVADPLDAVDTNCEDVLRVTHMGTFGPDVLTGATANDVMLGRDGADTVRGMEGADEVRGDAGNDTLYGAGSAFGDSGGGNDRLVGASGEDILVGSNNADALSGGPDNDTIDDAPEDDAAVDRIDGGDGDDDIRTANTPHSKDIVDCGAGNDIALVDGLDDVSDHCEDITITLTAEEEAAEDPLNEAPPPEADLITPTEPDGTPEEAFTYDSPLETETVNADGTVTTQDIAGTNCKGRTDHAHRSEHATPRHSEASGKTGVWRCAYEKRRIWVDVAMQRWVPWTNGGYWKIVRRKMGSEYNTKENIKNPAYKCPTRTQYWYRTALLNATIVDHDGDWHRMKVIRYGKPRFFKCEPR